MFRCFFIVTLCVTAHISTLCSFTELMQRKHAGPVQFQGMTPDPGFLPPRSQTEEEQTCVARLLLCCMPVISHPISMRVLEATDMAPCVVCYYLNRICSVCREKQTTPERVEDV